MLTRRRQPAPHADPPPRPPPRSRATAIALATLTVVANLAAAGFIAPVVPAEAATIPPASTGTTFPARSLILDLGVVTAGQTQQTTNQALKPYGLVYQFLVTRKIPVYWAIANGKAAGNPPNVG